MKKIVFLSIFLFSHFCMADNVSTDFLNQEIENSYEEYMNGSFETAIYSMKALIRLLEIDSPLASYDKVGPILSFTYIRLGFLYEHLSLEQDAHMAFSKGLEVYVNPYNDFPLDELKELVKGVDRINGLYR